MLREERPRAAAPRRAAPEQEQGPAPEQAVAAVPRSAAEVAVAEPRWSAEAVVVAGRWSSAAEAARVAVW